MVKMIREDGKTADVHQDMVEDYKKGGYKIYEGNEVKEKRKYNKRNTELQGE